MASYRDILVLCDTAGTLEARLAAALALAHRHGARLTGLALVPPPITPAVADAPLTAGAVEQEHEAARAAADGARERFQSYCQQHGGDVPTEWTTTEAAGYIPAAEVARYHDLVIAPQTVTGPADGAMSAGGAGDLVMESGRPVLVLPDSLTEGQAAAAMTPQRVLVGWNGKRENARAVADALPLLGDAEKVLVATVDRDSNAAPGAGLSDVMAAHLRCHALPAEARRLASGPGSGVFQTLAETLAAESGQLAVMGAYGHSRLRQLLLGGMTARALRSLQVPTLLSH